MTEDLKAQLIDALHQSSIDLKLWMQRLSVSEDEVYAVFEEVLRANGLMAQAILNQARSHLPDVAVDVTAAQVLSKLSLIKTGRIAEGVEEGSDQTKQNRSSREVNQVKRSIRDALPALRQDLTEKAKAGPQHRHGKRPRKLVGRENEVLESLRSPRLSGVKLNDRFERVAQMFGVSASKVKQIYYQSVAKSKDTTALDN